MSKKSLQTKKSFTRVEVEEYVKTMLTSSEVTMSEQKDRILELKKENEQLVKDKKDLQEKLKTAQRAGQEQDRINRQNQKDNNLQTKLIVEKVQQFGYKWKNYFADLFSEIESLNNNTSVDLFATDVNELIEEVIEATNFRASLSEKSVPTSAEVCLNEDEWLDRKIKKLAGEPTYSLSEQSEEKYKKVLNRLKNNMVYASELKGENGTGFNMEEALNPKDSLDKIIDDLKD